MSPTSGELERERIRKKKEIVISDMSVCYYCKSTGLKEEDKFCPHCGFPQQGSQSEMQGFVARLKEKRKLLDEQRKQIKSARSYLYLLGAINLIFGVISSVNEPNQMAIIIASAIIAGIYFGLAIWCNTNPFAAILSGFFIYIVLIVINGIVDPTTLYKGIVLRIVIISSFYYGYKAVKNSERLSAELEAINTATDLNESDEMRGVPAGE